MRGIAFVFICISTLSFLSCESCEDSTIKVDDNLLSWLTYDSQSELMLTNQDGETIVLTVISDVETKMENDGDCVKSIVRPYFKIYNSDFPDLLILWLMRQEGLLSDTDQLWATIRENDTLAGSGAILNFDNPESVSTQVSLLGLVYNDVITLEISKNGILKMTLYLQKNMGIVGLDYQDTLWTKI